MHEAEPYGALLVNGTPVTERQLASLAGVTLRETQGYVAELRDAGVFSEVGGTIVSRRMQRDEAKAQLDRENGRAGGNPDLVRRVNPADNRTERGRDKAQTPEARIQTPVSDRRMRAVAGATRPAMADDRFEEFKQAYPKRRGANPWRPARQQWDAALKAGADPDRIIAAVKAGAGFDREKVGTEFIPQAVKWLRDRRFEDHAESSNGADRARVGHYAAADSPELDAWDAHTRAATGRSLPRDRSGGWYVPARWPPGHAPQ